ncbi:timeless-domain-containing protein [Hypoxylon trugodes]|uniref:timeless-domain-containing protein n=1 Tax=Hypoxylon trugodes TaxID=326681 RepID=UPI0021A07B99|nr:timeless-domain-containing protein [Hypoxylon trugodes]KAI1391374.1 timeless-domain-containing protein [Hypoxylon trugodes]
MEASEITTDVVHPEVRAHINSLVSALGGFSADDDGRYVLGDSALEVLRDIKKWIRFYDEKTNRMDVARCLAEANVVDGDLLHILATWPENATDNKFRARAALACFEIMVPLTWPLERDLEQMTVNHHRHLPVLQLAQIGYKRAIINFDAAQILHTAVRVALPSMALSRSDRSTRDEGIIKLVLLFLRNVAMISPPPGVKYDGDESQISRSALIDAFSYQDILLTLLTIASNMGEDFNQEGIIVMEIIFHLVKRVDVTKPFMDDKQLGKAQSNELTAMMNKEAAMHRPYNRKAPSRHNRWGTMIWVDRGDGKVSTVTGQDALLDAATRQYKMDNSKTYRPPRRPRKEEMEPKDLGPPVSLNARARQQLKAFVEEFLDSGFNPLFLHNRKKLDEQKDYVFEYHPRQFFYLVSWFLEAERVRKKAAKDSKTSSAEDIGSFNLVAAVLNQEMFITLNRAIGDSLESKRWPELCAAMRCFTQILLTVQEMSESGNEDDEEIAENILSRIFYEEETHDRITNIAKNYKDQGFDYLDACTELTHTYLRVLEAYSKQNVDMQVRSRRRVRKKKKAANAAREDEENPVEDVDDSDNDQANAEKTSRERKFDFNRFVNRFTPQGVVDTFVKFTKYYQDLDESQLKRAHRYFYRIAFKQNMSVMLFRVDIIQLFYSMIKGQEPLDKSCSMYKEWEELVKQILKKCIRKIEERPQLIIEMLFSKINATAHYLEYGYEKQTLSTAQSRPGAELEFRHVVDRDQQIAIAVGVLLDKNLEDHINWLKGQLVTAEVERRAWEAAEKALPSVEGGGGENEGEQQNTESALPAKEAPPVSLQPDRDTRRIAIFKNSQLRLLMKLAGFERLVPSVEETVESAWVLPSNITADQIQDTLDLIKKAEFSPPTFEDGKLAEDQLRRKAAPRKKAVFDDDDGIANDDDDEILFPAGGPTARKVADEFLDEPKKTRRRRRRRGSDAEEPSDEQLQEKAKAKKEREKAKARRFKSELYVHASDDESDEDSGKWAEFYKNEERIRQRQNKMAREQGAVGVGTVSAAAATKPETVEKVKTAGKEKRKRKRKAKVLEDESGSGGEGESAEDNDDDLILGRESEDEDDSEDGDGDTPLSSSPRASVASAKRRRLSKEPSVLSTATPTPADGDGDVDMEDVDEDEDAPVKAAARRPRARAGFVVDSSDDEE